MKNIRWMLGPILIFLLAGCAASVTTAPPAGDQPQRVPAAPAIDRSQLVELLPLDALPSIDAPQFEDAAAGPSATEMKPDERVIGLVINGDARAYPLNILSNHEIVNDSVGGEPVAITWCPLCYSALVFSRRVDNNDGPLTFGVSGQLLKNTLVMFDRQSGSLWSQLYGAAIDGPFDGTSLDFFSSTLTDWETWQAQYPDSKVLSKRATRVQFDRPSYSESPRTSYAVDVYASYYAMPDEGVVNANIPRDARAQQAKQRVLGVRNGETARAYPFRVLAEERVVNDALAELPVLIWFDPASQTARAYDRRADGRTLTFAPADDAPDQLTDLETGSRWNPLTGAATDGPLAGARLSPLVATPAFEFGWYGYFPESDTYGE